MTKNDVLHLCASLEQASKKPSVALIRSHTPTPISLPTIIQGLKHWQTLSAKQKKTYAEQTSESHSERTVVAKKPEPAALEERVRRLETEVDELKARLDALTNTH